MQTDKPAYAETQIDERRRVRQAEVVAAHLLKEGKHPRQEDEGPHRFWILDAHCESGLLIAYQPGVTASTSGWMGGELYLLLDDGRVAYGAWREEPFGSRWTIKQVTPTSVSSMTRLDYIERGGWRNERPLDKRREQLRQEFYSRPRLEAPYAGYGLRRALDRLQTGEGLTREGHVTGVRYLPRSPI